MRASPSDFVPGDVVVDEYDPWWNGNVKLGIITQVGQRSIVVVWNHGGLSCGPGLLEDVRLRWPLVRDQVPAGALGHRGWNREQAVKAALRHAGIASDPASKERGTAYCQRLAVALNAKGVVAHVGETGEDCNLCKSMFWHFYPRANGGVGAYCKHDDRYDVSFLDLQHMDEACLAVEALDSEPTSAAVWAALDVAVAKSR